MKLSNDELEFITNVLNDEIKTAESYLDGRIRSDIIDNYKYYNMEEPAPVKDGLTYIDNTCSAVVDHFVAQAKDAFVNGDTVEIAFDDPALAHLNDAVTDTINDVLDRQNNRTRLYTDMFKDAAISKVGILKPRIHLATKIETVSFEGTKAQLIIEEEQHEALGHEIVEVEVEDVSQEVQMQLPDGRVLINQSELLRGNFKVLTREHQIVIDTVPPENFIINADARTVKQARIAGHKAVVTVSDLFTLGFDEDLIIEAAEKGDASNFDIRGSEFGNDYQQLNTNVEKSQQPVTLYEVYLKSTLEDNYGEAKLYRIFYCNEVILDIDETDIIPYACAVINPTTHSFWGTSLVDKTKKIQKANTGIIRQAFNYNALQTSPKYMYRGIRERDLMNNKPGAGIHVEEPGGFVTPVQLGSLNGESGILLQMLTAQREQGTGVSLTGQSVMSEVLKAGGSTISASMVLSENQMLIKDSIRNILDSGIKPLIELIYLMLKELPQYAEYEGLPDLVDIRLKCPLGTSAKLEKAQAYGSLLEYLNNPAARELTDTKINAKILRKMYKLQGIDDIEEYILPDEEIDKRQNLQGQIQQVTDMLQQAQAQLQAYQKMDEQFKEREMAIKEQEAAIKKQQADQQGQIAADNHELALQKAQADMQIAADQMSLKEREIALRETQTAYEIETGVNMFRN